MNVSGNSWIDASRLTVIVGHFGSGKTEIALNLAMAIAAKGHPFALADLDVIDPYFRSRECREMLEAAGGRLIASSPGGIDADLPSMPAEIASLFDNEDVYGVLDIGGDASGARVLARYRRRLAACGARVLCVVNANRPLTDTPEKAAAYVRSIEAASGLKIDGLVNNTHLCSQTELCDVEEGARLAAEVSRLTGVPVLFHSVPRRLAEAARGFADPVFPMELYMKKPWEQEREEE